MVVFDGDVSRVGEYTHVSLDRTTGVTFAGTETAGILTAADA